MILQRVTPVTHSVGNCLKRVIVIVASVIVFQNPMSKQNMIGEQSCWPVIPMPDVLVSLNVCHCSELQIREYSTCHAFALPQPRSHELTV